MKPIHANQLLAGLALAEPEPITAVVTDSRKVVPGCVFVCFPGERVDGHDYAAAAYKAGAAYIIANHPVDGVPEDRTVIVASSHHAMVRMASNYRMLFSPLMIGVTGSVGKTTTKEFCYAVLSAFGNTLKTEGNQNNEIGLPNTLFRLDDSTEYAVVEMGMSSLGEIDRLVRAARPSAGIITRIGVSHLENLGTRENILKAKLEICHGLPDGAPLVLNADDDMLPKAKLPERLNPVWFGIDAPDADVRALKITAGDSGTDLHPVRQGKRGIPGAHPYGGPAHGQRCPGCLCCSHPAGTGPCRQLCSPEHLPDHRHAGQQDRPATGGVTVDRGLLHMRSPDSTESGHLGAVGWAQAPELASPCWGICWNWGMPARKAHRQAGDLGWHEAGDGSADRLRPAQRRHGGGCTGAEGVTTVHCRNRPRGGRICKAKCTRRRCIAGKGQSCHEAGPGAGTVLSDAGVSQIDGFGGVSAWR